MPADLPAAVKTLTISGLVHLSGPDVVFLPVVFPPTHAFLKSFANTVHTPYNCRGMQAFRKMPSCWHRDCFCIIQLSGKT